MDFAPSSIGSEVEQLTHDPRFNGLNPVAASTWREKIAKHVERGFL